MPENVLGSYNEWKLEKDASSGAPYNADIKPIQNPIVSKDWTNIFNPEHREKMAEFSEYLAKHTYKIIDDIVTRGWEYEKPKKKENSEKIEETEEPEESEDTIDIEEWSDELNNVFIKACALGAIVDTSFILQMTDEEEDKEVFKFVSRNYVYKPEVFGTKGRKIEKVTIEFPPLPMLKNKKGESFIRERKTFFTQHYKGKEKIFAVVITLDPHEDSCFGKPFSVKEIQTGYEKIMLREYEMVSLHKGGILHEIITVPKLSDKTVAIEAKKDVNRAIHSGGSVIGIPKGLKVNEVFSHTQVPMGKMDFQTVNTHLSEDSPITKQEVEGVAESGALGGIAPQVNVDEKDKYIINFQKVLEPVIKDINKVFFGIEQDSYEVKFKKEIKDMEGGEKDGGTDNGRPKPKPEPTRTDGNR